MTMLPIGYGPTTKLVGDSSKSQYKLPEQQSGYRLYNNMPIGSTPAQGNVQGVPASNQGGTQLYNAPAGGYSSAGVPWTGSGGDISSALQGQGLDSGTANHYGALVRQGQMSPDQVMAALNGQTGGGMPEHHGMSYGSSAAEYWDAYSKYAPKYAKLMKKTMEKLYPNQSGLGEYLAHDVKKRLRQDNYDVPDEVRNQYTQSLRGAQSDRGLYRSGMASNREAADLTNMGIQMRDSDLNRAERLASGIPIATPNMAGTDAYYGAQLASANSQYASELSYNLGLQNLQQDSLNSWRNYQLQSNAQENQGGFNWGGLLGMGLGLGLNFALPGLGGLFAGGLSGIMGNAVGGGGTYAYR